MLCALAINIYVCYIHNKLTLICTHYSRYVTRWFRPLARLVARPTDPGRKPLRTTAFISTYCCLILE